MCLGYKLMHDLENATPSKLSTHSCMLIAHPGEVDKC